MTSLKKTAVKTRLQTYSSLSARRPSVLNSLLNKAQHMHTNFFKPTGGYALDYYSISLIG